jgi:hypothetical protein
VQKYNKLLRVQIFFVFFNPTGICILFFIWACRRGGYSGIYVLADVETCHGASLQNGRDSRRRAVGLSALMILA